jgi:hypothetical protein
MMWWDRNTFANHAEPIQTATTISELMTLNRQLDWVRDIARPRVSSV